MAGWDRELAVSASASKRTGEISRWAWRNGQAVRRPVAVADGSWKPMRTGRSGESRAGQLRVSSLPSMSAVVGVASPTIGLEAMLVGAPGSVALA